MIQTIIGLLFLIAAFQKVRNLPAFQSIIREYAILSHTFSIQIAAILISATEFAVALSLLSGIQAQIFSALAIGFLAVITGIVTATILRRFEIRRCGCGVIPKEKLGWPIIVRNLGLICFLGDTILPSRMQPVALLVGIILIMASIGIVVLNQNTKASIVSLP